MAQCEWAILCDYAFRDEGRKTCVIGIFDRIFTKGVPSAHHQAALVLRLSGQPGEQTHVRVELVRPTGGGLAKLEADVTLGPNAGADVQLNFAGMPLPDYGTYSFNVYLDDDLGKTIPFQVVSPPSVGPS